MADRGDGLELIEPFIGDVAAALEPGPRKKLLDRFMRALRRANVQRIAKNVEPDDGKMNARKPRKGKRGKMFRHIGKQSSLRIRTTADEGELFFANGGIERAAATHHFGEVGFVGKTRWGKIIRTKYDARRLLGIGKEAGDLAADALKHLAGEG